MYFGVGGGLIWGLVDTFGLGCGNLGLGAVFCGLVGNLRLGW